jgi:L-threonylcarbamoyladenylate synthase
VRAFGGPITASSANPSGWPPARTPAEAAAYFPDLLVLGDAPTPGGAPSTLVRVTARGAELLRAGAVAFKE